MRVTASSTILAIRPSNEIPAASAASGSSDVSVSPGIAFASSNVSSPVLSSSIRSTRAKPEQPSVAYAASASSCARAVASGPMSAGHTNAVRPIS